MGGTIDIVEKIRLNEVKDEIKRMIIGGLKELIIFILKFKSV